MSDNSDSNQILYTDVFLEMASMFMLKGDAQTVRNHIESIFDDETINGPGMFPGLLYSGILHFCWALATTAEALEISIEEALTYHTKMYFDTRDAIAKMPTVQPNFVNMVSDFYMPDE